jgi:hypothetical protein
LEWDRGVVALALVQPLHGITFAAFHLAAMRLIAVIVPAHLAATGQAIYALGAAGMSALLVLAAGFLYARFGAEGFFAIALLSLAALPLARGLRVGRSNKTRLAESSNIHNSAMFVVCSIPQHSITFVVLTWLRMVRVAYGHSIAGFKN